jgi:hypothetical protein
MTEREGARERGREGGKEGGREGGREGEREREKERILATVVERDNGRTGVERKGHSTEPSNDARPWCVVCGVRCVEWCVCVGGGGSEEASWWSNACGRATLPKLRVNWQLPVCGEANMLLMCS